MGSKPLAIINKINYIVLECDTMSTNILEAAPDAYALDTLKDKLKHARAQFDRAQDMNADLLCLVPAEQRVKFTYFENNRWGHYQEIYVKLTQELETRLDALYKSRDERTLSASSPFSSTFAPHHQQPTSSVLKLPKLELAPFDGSYDTWQNFNDIFTASVHNNHTLSGAVKMQHLKSLVRGEAANLISALSCTDDNYNVAWNALKERYENKRHLITHHLNRLSALPNVSQDSLSKMRQMRDTIQMSLDSLDLLQCETEKWGPYLVHQMVQKFNMNLRKEWEKSLAGSTDYPDFKTFKTFLNNQIHILENVDLHKATEKEEHVNKGSKANTRTSMNTSVDAPKQANQSNCGCCGQNHQIYKCEEFLKMSPTERDKLRKEKRLCFNCLRPKHVVKDCKCSRTCLKCGKRHHTLLHWDRENKSNNKNLTKKEDKKEEIKDTITNLQLTTTFTEVMLATALVKVIGPKGHTAITRALIDSGGEASFVSESLVQSLHLRRTRTDITINGLQGIPTSSPKYSTTFEITHARREGDRYEVDAFILQDITAYRPKSFQPKQHPELRDLDLADPEPSRALRIEMLLGADVLGAFMRDGFIRLRDSQVIAQATSLGWILSGPINKPQEPRSITVQHSARELPELLQRFWELEEGPDTQPSSAEDERCEKIFRETTTRDSSGRYQVRLPFISDTAMDELGESQSIAVAAWKRVRTRLDQNPEARKIYDEFLEEYESLNHMTELKDPEEAAQGVYNPHHGVIRDDSKTTKLRVVFNASSNTKSGKSLNDVLCTGPKLQNEIADVITNWRIPVYVYTADITKMFRQILVHPEDRKYQCIVWSKAGDDTIRYYALNTVTYGTKPAPYLANRIIKALIEDHADEYPLAVESLDKCIYVDDTLFGADTRELAIAKRQQVEAMLQRGGLQLRKWSANDPELLPAADDNMEEFYLEPEGESDKKVLGIVWSPQSDQFSVKVNEIDNTTVTKRGILSTTAKLFDPLGWLSPIVIRAKLIMQSLWLLKTGWDDPNVTEEIKEMWISLCNDLEELKQLKIPRFIGPGRVEAKIKLVGFSDASKRAYAAAVYLYVEYETGETKSHLIRAKSKVAPIKTVSIPRLELLGAVELTKLIKKVQTGWLGKIDEVECYTDSRIVLDWLAKHASNWHTFVANRVSLIQTELPNLQWKHVTTKKNPADLNSRGLGSSDLLDSKLWWNGPDLQTINSVTPSPEEQQSDKIEVAREACHVITVHHDIVQPLPAYLTQTTSWLKLIRILGYCAKYLRNLLSRVRQPAEERVNLRDQHLFRTQLQVQKLPQETKILTKKDIQHAAEHVYRVVQEQAFSSELAKLREQLPVSKGSPLYQLSPFIDEKGVLRVGGRLRHSELSYEQKHPVILPQDRIANVIIRYHHLKALHGGLQLTLSLLRERYWIIHARNRTKLILSKCVICARYRAKLETQRMGDLPSERCSKSRPFSHVGLDYAGHFWVKNFHGRGQHAHKFWVVIFVCFATRAVHLEAVGDCTTETFLAAFKRFASRRGVPSDVYSDQAPTLKGADRELHKEYVRMINDPEFRNDLVVNEIQWHKIPPKAPHMGGLWEAAVKSVKHHLKGIIGKFIPDREEMSTILCQVEACLNSRPVTPQRDVVSEDPALTPGHFLIGTSLKAVPTENQLNKRESLLTRWQTTTRIVQTFWKRWQREYLQTLQRRDKWAVEMENIKVGDIVLMRDKDRPPCNWPIAVVIAVTPGRDQLIREVRIRTENSEYTRPIHELCKLPTEPDTE